MSRLSKSPIVQVYFPKRQDFCNPSFHDLLYQIMSGSLKAPHRALFNYDQGRTPWEEGQLPVKKGEVVLLSCFLYYQNLDYYFNSSSVITQSFITMAREPYFITVVDSSHCILCLI
jgi:hypothetical protein